MSKTFWRAVWLAAVSLGGISLVMVALRTLKTDSKNYIDV